MTTLRTLYEECYAPHNPELKPGTKRGIEYALRIWKRHTGDPPVDSLTAESFDAFRRLAFDGTFSTTTIEVTIGTLFTILRFAERTGAIEQLPEIGKRFPTTPPSKSPAPTLADLNAAYEKAEVANWPFLGLITAGDFWRAWLVCSYFTGLHLADMKRLTWSCLGEDSLTIGNRIFPLTPRLRRHLEGIRRPGDRPEDRIFPVNDNRSIHGQLARISQAADTTAPLNPIALRRLARIEWQKARPGGGQILLSPDHVPGILEGAVKNLEIPPAFGPEETPEPEPESEIDLGPEIAESPEAIRLGGAFEKYLLPQLRRQSNSHKNRYRTVIKHWENLTRNPPVLDIDDACLQRFVDNLAVWHRERGFRGNSNTRKILEHLLQILRACCPRSIQKRGQPKGRHLIEEMPVATPPGNDIQRKRVADLAEIGEAYQAAAAATWPNSARGSAPDLWRLLLLFAYNYGPRTGDLLALRWEMVRWESECPAAEVARLDSPFGWLVYTPSKTLRHKPTPLVLPLTQCVRAHLEMLRPGPDPSGPIFGFPKNMVHLHEQRKRIFIDAGVAEPYTFQELRKTASTSWNDLSRGLGEHVTGHAARGINSIHYDTEVRRLARFAPKLPQPVECLNAVGLDRPDIPNARAKLGELVRELTNDQAELLLKIAENLV